ARAAERLAIGATTLEEALFSDLPGERRIAASEIALEPAELALRANLVVAQRLLFKATRVRLELEGNARTIVRHAKLRGLLGTVVPRRAPADLASGSMSRDALLELSGPLALFKRTILYGRALAELVPLLAWCDRFRLVADVIVEGRSLVFELRT